MKIQMWAISLYLFAFTCAGLPVFAQGSNQIYDLPKVTPPSPNAASLGKYGDIPVGLYTGIPNISIPLYTIQVGKFSLPISLSYHSQGLKVEEQSGWVGLGWTLNAGGAVTRTVHGSADEGSGGYWLSTNYSIDSIASSQALSEEICNGTMDLQPDIFYYNFGSYSGKFVMDNTPAHTAHFIPYNNFKVSQSGNLSQITITDDDGIQYVFGNIETTTDDNGGATIAYYTSSWYLTEIITPYGNINFSYTAESTSSVQNTQIDYLLTSSTENGLFKPGSYQFERTLTNNSVILSSISFPAGKIAFSTSPNRKDMPSASAITGFSVYDFNNNLKKQVAFSQRYFGDTTSNQSGAMRLKLDSVTEVNLANRAQSKSYVLTYYNPQSVPPITSMSQDYWGFYNGQNNTSLLPFIDPLSYGVYIANQAATNGYGNRNVSFANTLIGTLTQIKYPTGGTSQFIYESNDYGNLGGFPNDSLAHIQMQVAVSAAISGTTNIPSTTATFRINTPQNIQINIHGAYSNPPPVENGPSITINKINADGTLTAVYQRALVNTTTVVYTTTPLDTGNYELISSVDGTAQSMNSIVTYISLGTTPIKTIVCGGLRIRQIINTDPMSGQSTVKTFRYVTATDSTRSSGGLVTLPQLTEYESSSYFTESYLVRTANSCNYLGYTQGSIVGYSTVTEADSAATGNGKKVSSFIGVADYPNNPCSLYKIINLGDMVQLPNSYRYNTDLDACRGFLKEEDTYNASNILLHKHVVAYNLPAATSTLAPNYTQLLSRAGWFYTICDSTCSKCYGGDISVDPYNPSWGDGGICTDYILMNMTMADDWIICPWIYKTNEVDTLYDMNGANPVISAKNYYYDNPAHGLPTRTVTNRSNQDSLVILTSYPQDYLPGTPFIDSLVSHNVISAPIENVAYQLTPSGQITVLGGKITTYLPNGEGLPSQVQLVVTPAPLNLNSFKFSNVGTAGVLPFNTGTKATFSPDPTYVARANFINYDSYNNITQDAKVGDFNHAYLWDYNGTYLIAQVSNAALSDIAYTSFEANGTGNWIIPDTTRIRSYAMTGTNCYGLNSGNTITASGLNSGKTYIVSYWSRAGSMNVNGTSGTLGNTVTAGGYTWNYYEHTISGTTSISVSGAAAIDELRLFPKGSLMTTYTYASLIGMTSQCTPTNYITYYSYDGLNRLNVVKDMRGNLVKTYNYNYMLH